MAYGGTELFIAHLAGGLSARGHRVTVYANGESRVPVELKWRYRCGTWPIRDTCRAQLENADHTAWAMRDAAQLADIVHLNDTAGIPFTLFVATPTVLTIHHPHEPALSEQYERYPGIHYVAISDHQARSEPRLHTEVVHHGLPLEDYEFSEEKDDYVAFLGRIAPCKGAHLAIDAARKADVPIKLAGEIQPVFHDYWKQQIVPRLGPDAEYIGEADLAAKNELLSHARALLFPIQWHEPFGLVMIEAMACGTPVIALSGGSVREVIRPGVSGWICRDVDELAERAADPQIAPSACRQWVAERFSIDRMVDRYVDVYERAIVGEPDWIQPSAEGVGR